MFKIVIIPLLLSQALCGASNRPFSPREKTTPEYFPWHSFEGNTGVDWKSYIKTPAAGVSVTYACTKKPGPDPVDCSSVFADWDAQADSNGLLHVDAGQCASLTEGTCEAVVCAPLGVLSVEVADVVGHMWNPLSIKCIMGGTSAIYQSEDSEFVVGVARPV